jgi:hypothetical protein
MSERETGGRKLLFRWVWATWAGWLLGVPLIIALAVLGETVGIGGAQVFVGAGMGAGVGLFQRRAIRSVLDKSVPWLWSSVGGLAAPFLITDIASAAGLSSIYSLHAAVAIGGLIVGTWQATLLGRRFRKTKRWVVASTLGWTMAGSTAAISTWLSHRQQVRGVWGLAAYLGFIALGGPILGLTTGVMLVSLPRQEVETSPARSAAVEG